MIKFFSDYTKDEKANKLLKEFINEQILNHIEFATELVATEEGIMIPEDFLSLIEAWFPETDLIDEELKTPIVLGLYQKLTSDELENLTTIEKFVVYRILEEAHEVEMDMSIGGFAVDPLPEIRYLYGIIHAEGIAEEAECKPADILILWRNLSEACIYLFEDTDFLLLNLVTKEMAADISELV